jgi:hypothetical protein
VDELHSCARVFDAHYVPASKTSKTSKTSNTSEARIKTRILKELEEAEEAATMSGVAAPLSQLLCRSVRSILEASA